MTILEPLHADCGPNDLIASSGVRIEPIYVDTARTFLDRLGESDCSPFVPYGAWGAFEDGSSLIAVGTLSTVTPTRGHVHLAVLPDHRRLRIGGDLLARLMIEAEAEGFTMLGCTLPADATAPIELVRSQQLMSARRVSHQQATMVMFVPHVQRPTFPEVSDE